MAQIFLSAGEASGEAYAVELLHALRTHLPEAKFFGLGGHRMEEAGFRAVVHAGDVAVLGITEILRHVPRIWRAYGKLKRTLAEQRPDVAVLIDFPDVNLALARVCRRLGIPVIFFVSPQVWAWKQYRLRRIRRDVTRMLVIFPFEEPWYHERGVPARFVGHPLADVPLPSITREQFAEEHGLQSDRRFIALLPGSRPREIALNLPAMLGAAALLEQEQPDTYEFLLPLAPTLSPEQISVVRQLAATHGKGLPLVYTRDARATLFHARGSVVASGTATVEAALLGNPFIVVYRLSELSYAIARRAVRVPHVAMANLIAGYRLIPELLQNSFTPEAVCEALMPLLDDGPQRISMMDFLARFPALLHHDGGAIENVAEIVASYVQRQPSSSHHLHPSL